jgi:hypothetical protein
MIFKMNAEVEAEIEVERFPKDYKTFLENLIYRSEYFLSPVKFNVYLNDKTQIV